MLRRSMSLAVVSLAMTPLASAQQTCTTSAWMNYTCKAVAAVTPDPNHSGQNRFQSQSKTSGTGKDEANVTVGMNDDGTYSVSMGAPGIKGVVSGSQTSSYSGQCTTKERKTVTLPDTPTSIQGGSLTSDGKARGCGSPISRSST